MLATHKRLVIVVCTSLKHVFCKSCSKCHCRPSTILLVTWHTMNLAPADCLDTTQINGGIEYRKDLLKGAVNISCFLVLNTGAPSLPTVPPTERSFPSYAIAIIVLCILLIIAVPVGILLVSHGMPFWSASY